MSNVEGKTGFRLSFALHISVFDIRCSIFDILSGNRRLWGGCR